MRASGRLGGRRTAVKEHDRIAVADIDIDIGIGTLWMVM